MRASLISSKVSSWSLGLMVVVLQRWVMRIGWHLLLAMEVMVGRGAGSICFRSSLKDGETKLLPRLILGVSSRQFLQLRCAVRLLNLQAVRRPLPPSSTLAARRCVVFNLLALMP